MGVNEKQTREVVKKWFTETARHEWRRLRRNPYHQIEFITTMHFLEKHLPKKGLILDAGDDQADTPSNLPEAATTLSC
ncbi:hypothetical protein COS86_03170 [Candidatus Bathyarchaeota archaeon CG07_land_8_20_14_0_80_47_9]|jgi:hypothetical protein|nr:MAG: hypothetical protein COS86_03170 [Candidatus Bathyarchaeota archaeon CG07_land_8_20_14_0_80_47_9]